jgi:glyoxylase-like metal-dependent hydrolase (beta-lactamase superfamily II)
LTGGAVLLGALSASKAHSAAVPEAAKADNLAPDVYFQKGDILGRGLCNNGWIIFEDYVLVIDANFPSGALEVLPKIRALTDKPIRFVFDTHHHGDHLYGNQIWVENGAIPVAHTGVIDELKKYETGYYGGPAGRWEGSAKGRPDVKASRLTPPSLLFSHDLVFDDGRHRVELIYFGVAHTHGDAVAWLPKERILYTGDMCVNGPFNYVGDGNIEQWVKTLDAVRKLDAQIVCPGHGDRGGAELLDNQLAYFKALQDEVGKLVAAGKSAGEIKKEVPNIKAAISSNGRIARFIPSRFANQVEKVFTEMTGNKFPAA